MQGRLKERREKQIKGGAKTEPLLSSLRVFWVSLLSHLEDVFSLAFQVKLSCNIGPSVTSNFCCGKTESRKLQTPQTSSFGLPPNMDQLVLKNIYSLSANNIYQKHLILSEPPNCPWSVCNNSNLIINILQLLLSMSFSLP